MWVIDSHPQDINQVDFVRPDGTPQMATIGDERQTNDGSFNAGLNSGSSYEYEDAPNRLHFCIIDKRIDSEGLLHYKVAVNEWSTCTFPLTNTGAAAAVPNVHPQDAATYLSSDVYRLSASATGTGWHAQLKNALATAKFGDDQRPGVRGQGRHSARSCRASAATTRRR